MNKILIIGNGFDLNLGFKTSYSDFLKSKEFLDLLGNKTVLVKGKYSTYHIQVCLNSLANYLSSKQEVQKWVDVEHELKNYAATVGITERNLTSENVSRHVEDLLSSGASSVVSSDFEADHISLKSALSKYLYKQFKSIAENSNFNFHTPAVKLIRQGGLGDSAARNFNSGKVNYFNDVFSFNYTSSVSVLINYYNNLENKYTTELGLLKFVHGDLNSIVFGVEDNSVTNKHSFLLKSDHPNYGAVNLAREVSSAYELHFFGLSFGDTDNSHFEPVFKNLLIENFSVVRKKLFFYVYGFTEYKNLRERILKLTNNQLSNLKLNNLVSFYDVKSDCEIDSNWLNQNYIKEGNS